jgi:ribose transport system substrate-binding protein
MTCVIALAMLVAGCSSSATGGSGNQGSAGSTTQSQNGTAAQLAALYKGSSVSPATSGPKPQPGKKVWIISPDQSVDVAQEMTQGAADAARSIGWVPTVFDGKSQPNVMLAGVQQAIASKADGIILYAIDCSFVKTALEAAKAAHIPVVGAEAQDCTPSLETVITYAPTLGTFQNFESGGGVSAAQYLIAKHGTAGTFVELKETDFEADLLYSKGYESTLKAECPRCTNVVVTFTATDLGPALQEKTQQALLQHPNASGVVAPYDGVITSGVSSALMASGRGKTLTVVGTGGSVANLDLMRQGRGQTADLVVSTRWEGFATVDWLNRILHGITPNASNAETGIGYILVDADHGLPASGAVPSPVDFQAVYEKSWGVRP